MFRFNNGLLWNKKTNMKEHTICMTSYYYRKSCYNGMFLWNHTSGATGDDICK